MAAPCERGLWASAPAACNKTPSSAYGGKITALSAKRGKKGGKGDKLNDKPIDDLVEFVPSL